MVLTPWGGGGGAGCSWVEKLPPQARKELEKIAYYIAARDRLSSGDYVGALALLDKLASMGDKEAAKRARELRQALNLRAAVKVLEEAAKLIDEGRYDEAMDKLDAVVRSLQALGPWSGELARAEEEVVSAAKAMHTEAAYMENARDWQELVEAHLARLSRALREKTSVFKKISDVATAFKQLVADARQLEAMSRDSSLPAWLRLFYGRLAAGIYEYLLKLYSSARDEPLLAERLREAAESEGWSLPPPGEGMGLPEKLALSYKALTELLEGVAEEAESAAGRLTPLLKPAAYLASSVAWLASSLVGLPAAAYSTFTGLADAIKKRSLKALEDWAKRELESLVPRTPGQVGALVLGALLTGSLGETVLGRALRVAYDAANPVAAGLFKLFPRVARLVEEPPSTEYVEVVKAIERTVEDELNPARESLLGLSEELRRIGAEEAAERVARIAANLERYAAEADTLETLARELSARLMELERGEPLARVKLEAVMSELERLGETGLSSEIERIAAGRAVEEASRALSGEESAPVTKRQLLIELWEKLRRVLSLPEQERAEAAVELWRWLSRHGYFLEGDLAEIGYLISEGRLGDAYKLVEEKLSSMGVKPTTSLVSASGRAVETRSPSVALPETLAEKLGVRCLSLDNLSTVLSRLESVELTPDEAEALAKAMATLYEESRGSNSLHTYQEYAVRLRYGAVAAELMELARALPPDMREAVVGAAQLLLMGDVRAAEEELARALPPDVLRRLAGEEESRGGGIHRAAARLLVEAEEEAKRIMEETGRKAAGRVKTTTGVAVEYTRPGADVVAELERLQNTVEEVVLPDGVKVSREVVVAPDGEIVYRVEAVDPEGRWIRYVYRASPAGEGRYVVQERLYADPEAYAAEELELARDLEDFLAHDRVLDVLSRIKPVEVYSRLSELARELESALKALEALAGAAGALSTVYRIDGFTIKFGIPKGLKNLENVRIHINGVDVDGLLDLDTNTIYIPVNVNTEGGGGGAGRGEGGGEKGGSEEAGRSRERGQEKRGGGEKSGGSQETGPGGAPAPPPSTGPGAQPVPVVPPAAAAALGFTVSPGPGAGRRSSPVPELLVF